MKLTNTRGLITLWDMTQFYAEDLMRVSAFVEALQTFPQIHKWEWDDEGKEHLQKLWEGYAPIIKKIGCEHSARNVERFCSRGIRDCKDWNEVAIRTDMLRDALIEELESKVCLALSDGRDKYWEKKAPEILGEQCANRFPSVAYDIQEAFNCYAFGSFTACAFHLMRVSEAAVTAMAKALGCYDSNNQSWGKVFQAVNKQYDAFNREKKNALAPWDTHGEFLKNISGAYQAVGESWRNSTMHLEAKYTDKEAKDLCDIVPLFLKRVAEQLDQEGTWV